MLLKGALMGAALCGVLTIDKGVVLFAILIGMGEGYLDVVALHVDYGVETGGGHIVGEEVLQTIATGNATTIIHDGESLIEIGVVAEHRLYDVVVELVVLEQGVAVVGFEENECAVLIGGGSGGVASELALLEHEMAHLAVAIGLHLEVATEEIDCLDADTIESYGLLEGFGVVLTTGVELADSLNELALRDASTIVADRDTEIVLNIYLDALASVHTKLINGVVDDFLEQDIDTVFGQRTVAQSADIHTRTGADVLHVGEVANILVTIFYGCWGNIFFVHLVFGF